MDPWKILELEPTSNIRSIKRAYSVQLKMHKPDKDPEGYQRVRDAFEMAKSQAVYLDEQLANDPIKVEKILGVAAQTADKADDVNFLDELPMRDLLAEVESQEQVDILVGKPEDHEHHKVQDNGIGDLFPIPEEQTSHKPKMIVIIEHVEDSSTQKESSTNEESLTKEQRESRAILYEEMLVLDKEKVRREVYETVTKLVEKVHLALVDQGGKRRR